MAVGELRPLPFFLYTMGIKGEGRVYQGYFYNCNWDKNEILIKLVFCYTILLVPGSTLRPGLSKIFEGRQVIECARKTFITGTERLRLGGTQ